VKKFLVEFQEKFNYYYENKEVLDEILDKGRDKASFVANKTLKKMENAIGLGRKRK
ncbi:MAG TPA: tryptophan--tRNA ligase, partial [Staphylococcus sp.]|nr:tryptophan--tRNA ligase [Staphylococcus sp.]